MSLPSIKMRVCSTKILCNNYIYAGQGYPIYTWGGLRNNEKFHVLVSIFQFQEVKSFDGFPNIKKRGAARHPALESIVSLYY
jgi:hypothetical protein